MARVEQVGRHSWRVRYRTDSGYGSVSGPVVTHHSLGEDVPESRPVWRSTGSATASQNQAGQALDHLVHCGHTKFIPGPCT